MSSESSRVCPLWQVTFLPHGLYTPPQFPLQEALIEQFVFRNWRACIQKERVKETSSLSTCALGHHQQWLVPSQCQKQTPLLYTSCQKWQCPQLATSLLTQNDPPGSKCYARIISLYCFCENILVFHCLKEFVIKLFLPISNNNNHYKDRSTTILCSLRLLSFSKYAQHDLMLVIQVLKIITNVLL